MYRCDNCNSTSTYIKNYTNELTVKGKQIKFDSERRFCSDCHSLVYDHELDNNTIKKSIDMYNSKYGIPKEDIIALRKQYNLSVESFAKIIGCAKKTLVSYETGSSIPNDIYLVTIKTLIDNPEVIKNLIDSNKERYNESEYTKISKKINKYLSNNVGAISYNKDNELSEYNGYTEFSYDKLVNLISILSEKGIHKTKLLKEMFYVDFYLYKKYLCSLTGLEYNKLPYGPVPDDFEVILNKLSAEKIIDYKIIYHDNYEEDIITNKNKINYNVFSEDELEVINFIKNKFNHFSVREIVDYSHEEKAFIETEYSNSISYDLAIDLNI